MVDKKLVWNRTLEGYKEAIRQKEEDLEVMYAFKELAEKKISGMELIKNG